MIPLDRFTVVLDACTLFPMLVRDVLLTLAGHEFFNPKWSARIRAEWMRNLSERLGERSFHGNTVTQVQRIATAMDAAFPDAAIEFECAEAAILEPVHVKDRHVVAAAMAVQADAIVTLNIADFAVAHLKEHLQIEVIHPDDFVMDPVDLHEKRAVSAFRELRARKQNPPWAPIELIQRLQRSGLVQTSLWLSTEDVVALI
jgi:predicted nucleic acid-binding protein